MGKSRGEETGKTIIYSSVEANYQRKLAGIRVDQVFLFSLIFYLNQQLTIKMKQTKAKLKGSAHK